MVHGAGTKKRVKAGTRKSPKTAALKTGTYAQPETMELKLQLDPAYEHCLNQILRNPQLATLDEMANRIYAGLLALDYQDLTPDNRAERLKSLAFAISRVEQTRTTNRAQFEKEQRIFVDAVRKVFREFVPVECLIEARARLSAIVSESGENDDEGGDVTPVLTCPALGTVSNVS